MPRHHNVFPDFIRPVYIRILYYSLTFIAKWGTHLHDSHARLFSFITCKLLAYIVSMFLWQHEARFLPARETMFLPITESFSSNWMVATAPAQMTSYSKKLNPSGGLRKSFRTKKFSLHFLNFLFYYLWQYKHIHSICYPLDSPFRQSAYTHTHTHSAGGNLASWHAISAVPY